jgi:hypothetical protein
MAVPMTVWFRELMNMESIAPAKVTIFCCLVNAVGGVGALKTSAVIGSVHTKRISVFRNARGFYYENRVPGFEGLNPFSSFVAPAPGMRT